MRELVPKRNSLGAGGNRANQWKQALRSFITCSLGQSPRRLRAVLSH